MKRWGFVVALIYGLALALLTLPVLYAGFGFTLFGLLPGKVGSNDPLVAVYAAWGYWLWIGIMILAQAALLAVPVSLARGRPVRRRALWPTLLASGLAMAILAGTLLLALYFLLVGDGDGKGLIRIPSRVAEAWVWGILLTALLVWAAWAVVFRRISRSRGPEDLVAMICRFLLAGSILELLVAVPCHIAVRRREECCADIGTFVGIAAGISVMLFSFGPGVLFLYAKRWRRLHPKAQASAPPGS